ncbi:MAG TPA: glyoxalase [Candidatus Dormibacteraeota bacterium]|nr:glyoxalase [Candidatus Dormibacteraeota bacterium]
MMLYDHIDFRVANVALVRPLYDALLVEMGYTDQHDDAESVGYHRPNEAGTDAFFWIVQQDGHVPNGTRVAFAAQSRAEVDRLAATVREHGAREFEPPQLVAEYGPSYYAAFFEDAEGNALEICCRKPE